MLLIPSRSYKRKIIWLFTFTAILYALMLPFLNRQTPPLIVHFPQIKLLFATITFLMRGTIFLIALRTLFEGLTLHRPLLVADENGLRIQTGAWGGITTFGWDEISRANVSFVHGPEVFEKQRWQWRTLTLYAADPNYFARLGWHGKLTNVINGGAAFAVSDLMVGPQFDELVTFVNARIRRPG